MPKIILASNSPRRLMLLRQIGIEPVVIPSNVPEDILENESPEDAALRLARAKVEDVARKSRKGIVIGADTIVVIGKERLGKPADENDARRMLKLLSGRNHTVVTGLAVIDAETQLLKTAVVKTMVGFKQLTEDEIETYIATGEPMDKAGAYGIQGQAAVFIERIEGSYSNVVGLPLSELVDTLFSWRQSLLSKIPA